MSELRIPAVLSEGGVLPAKAHPGDGAADLRANAAQVIFPGHRALVPAGFSLAIPEGYAGLVLPRSGLALKFGITLLNSPGLVDAGYRGEVGIIVYNTSTETFEISVGDRIAQLMIVPVLNWSLQAVETLDETVRGEGGFGSSGQR